MPKITGADKVSKRLKGAIGPETVVRVGQALFAGAEMIRAEAAHLITEGAVSGKHHVPSLPGHPPNEDTGHLRINIETAQTGPLRAEVSSNARYSVHLEAGTSKMAARPYMGPATRRKRKEVVALVRRAVNKAVEG